MEFGQVQDITGIDFTLKEDAGLTRKVLTGTPSPHPHFSLGLTGWSDKKWIGNLYPPDAKVPLFLTYYAQSFSSVELNSTFYALPSSKTVQRWLAQTTDEFQFVPKVWQAISHRSDAGLKNGNLEAYLECMALFGSRAPATFLQLPPGHGNQLVDKLLKLCERWPSFPKLFIEFRNPTLLKNTTLLQGLHAMGIGLVITDTPGHRDLVHQTMPIPQVIIRFVACREKMDNQRLQEWKLRLQSWFSQGLEAAWFFCHEKNNMHAPDLARLFQQIHIPDDREIFQAIPKIMKYGSKQIDLFETAL